MNELKKEIYNIKNEMDLNIFQDYRQFIKIKIIMKI